LINIILDFVKTPTVNLPAAIDVDTIVDGGTTDPVLYLSCLTGLRCRGKDAKSSGSPQDNWRPCCHVRFVLSRKLNKNDEAEEKVAEDEKVVEKVEDQEAHCDKVQTKPI